MSRLTRTPKHLTRKGLLQAWQLPGGTWAHVATIPAPKRAIVVSTLAPFAICRYLLPPYTLARFVP